MHAFKKGHNEQIKKYIGDTDTTERAMNRDLASDQQNVLRDIHIIIGNTQVTITWMQSAPSWITTKALDDEHYDNWPTGYYEVA